MIRKDFMTLRLSVTIIQAVLVFACSSSTATKSDSKVPRTSSNNVTEGNRSNIDSFELKCLAKSVFLPAGSEYSCSMFDGSRFLTADEIWPDFMEKRWVQTQTSDDAWALGYGVFKAGGDETFNLRFDDDETRIKNLKDEWMKNTKINIAKDPDGPANYVTFYDAIQ